MHEYMHEHKKHSHPAVCARIGGTHACIDKHI